MVEHHDPDAGSFADSQGRGMVGRNGGGLPRRLTASIVNRRLVARFNKSNCRLHQGG